MKAFESWLQNRDQELYSEIDWKGLGQKAALATSLMMPNSGEAAPYKPTPQGKASIQKFHDVYSQAKHSPIVANQDGSITISSIGRNQQEAKEKAQAVFMSHMNSKFAKMGLEYKKNAFISPADQQVEVLVSQPLPDKKVFVYQVRVKVNSYRSSKNGPPKPINPNVSDTY